MIIYPDIDIRMEPNKRNLGVEEALVMIIKKLEDVSPKSKARAKMNEETQSEGERMSEIATRVAEKALKAYEDEGMRRTAQLDVFVMGVRGGAVEIVPLSGSIPREAFPDRETVLEETWGRFRRDRQTRCPERELADPNLWLLYRPLSDTPGLYSDPDLGTPDLGTPRFRDRIFPPKSYSINDHVIKTCILHIYSRTPI
eukprot:sb/3470741/